MDVDQLGILTISVLLAYLLGSVPTAVLISRAWGVNIRDVGTRNPGAANVFRSISPVAGSLVFLSDIGKGLLAVAIADALNEARAVELAAAVAVVVGHWYPVFGKFRGGAGLATAIGAGIGLSPLPGFIGLVVGMLLVAIIRNSGFAAGFGYAAFVLVSYLMDDSWIVILQVISLGAGVFLRNFAILRPGHGQ